MSYSREFTRKAYDDFVLLKQALMDAGYPEIQINLRLDSIVEKASTEVPEEAESKIDESSVFRRYYEYYANYVIQCAVDRDKELVLIERILLMNELA